MTALVLAFATLAGSPLHCATAQPPDVAAIERQFHERYNAADYAGALAAADALVEARKAELGDDSTEYADALNYRGNAYYQLERYAEGERDYKAAAAIHEADDPDAAMLGTILNNLGNLYRYASRPTEAIEVYRKALKIRESALGEGHARVADTFNGLGRAYNELGRYRESADAHRRALEIRLALYGEDNDDVATSLNNLALAVDWLGRTAEAEEHYTRSIAIREKLFGPDTRWIVTTLNNLAMLHGAQGRVAQAETLHKRALAIQERTFGPDHTDVASTLNTLGSLYRDHGRFREAEDLLTRALAIREKLGNPAQIAVALDSIAVVRDWQGRGAEAEGLYKRSLGLLEQVYGANHARVGVVLYNFGLLYLGQERYAEAEGLLRRALSISEATLGPEHRNAAYVLHALGNLAVAQDRSDDAEAYYKRVLTIFERDFDPNYPVKAASLGGLATAYKMKKNYVESEKILRQALAIYERAFGENHPSTATAISSLGDVVKSQGRAAEAERHFERALAVREKIFGPNHPAVSYALDDLAIMASRRGDVTAALAYSRRATGAIRNHNETETTGTLARTATASLVERRAGYFRRHLSYLETAALRGAEPLMALHREAFEIAQWASHSVAAAAVQQMAARLIAGRGAAAELVRESQDLSARWRNRDQALVAALSKPEAQQNPAAIAAVRQEIAQIDERLAAIAARLEREFPDYAALANPKPLPLDDARNLLDPDEALLFYQTGTSYTYVFALTRESITWRRIPLSADALSKAVSAVRRGLDVRTVLRGFQPGDPLHDGSDFDLATAHQLYRDLLGPVEAQFKGKRHLLIVPSGPLTGLPFHLLVGEPPPAATGLAAYRDTAWLTRRHPVSILPSVASLRALRVLAQQGVVSRRMIGFGDPLFGQSISAGSQSRVQVADAAAAARGYSDYFRGGQPDPDALRSGLSPLPDTADELRAVARNLGVPESDIHLGEAASETTVKHSPLGEYRIVYFATHGLIAGEVKGLGEPALALTPPGARAPPQSPSDVDDGLLTASEVAQLKLNADWVVLSACNTAAGDTPGAEALSGLARAFFYAGARALLVSHWAVSSRAATQLTTATFDVIKNNPGVGRAEALRRAMLAILSDASDPRYAHPAYWGPFSIVGEGAAR